MLENFPTPMIFAHRGACAHAPENTLSSFNLAVQQGADAIELDVKLSSDEQAMVIHDPTLERTTNGKGKVNEHSLEALKKLDAGTHFNIRFAWERIPTLDEVFESVGKRIFINVELTNYSSPNDNLIPVVAGIVRRHHLEDSVLFSSFLPRNLVHIHSLLPGTPVGLLCLEGVKGILMRSMLFKKTSPEALHPFLSDVNAALVAREHGRGRRVHVWTVNADADLKRMIDLKVDGFFTDDPLKALNLMGRK